MKGIVVSVCVWMSIPSDENQKTILISVPRKNRWGGRGVILKFSLLYSKKYVPFSCLSQYAMEHGDMYSYA